VNTINGDAAIAWMRAHSANTPGMCLNTVWQAYGSHDSIGAYAGQYPDALSAWTHATVKHPGDFNPPAGVPVYFGVSPTRTDSNAAAGDVVLSLGGGNVIGTDVGGAGRIGVTTIRARGAAISRPYLGWCEDFLGYSVVTAAFTGLNATPINGGFLMSLSDAEQAEALDLLRNLAGFVYKGGDDASRPDYLGADGTLYRLAKQPVQRTINGKTVIVPQIQDNADTNSFVRAIRDALNTITVGGIDPALIEKAAHDGAVTALKSLTLKAE
jgi:hypothetical protein